MSETGSSGAGAPPEAKTKEGPSFIKAIDNDHRLRRHGLMDGFTADEGPNSIAGRRDAQIARLPTLEADPTTDPHEILDIKLQDAEASYWLDDKPLEEISDTLQEILGERPNDPNAKALMGMLWVEAGSHKPNETDRIQNFKEAESYFKQARLDDPDNSTAHLFLEVPLIELEEERNELAKIAAKGPISTDTHILIHELTRAIQFQTALGLGTNASYDRLSKKQAKLVTAAIGIGTGAKMGAGALAGGVIAGPPGAIAGTLAVGAAEVAIPIIGVAVKKLVDIKETRAEKKATAPRATPPEAGGTPPPPTERPRRFFKRKPRTTGGGAPSDPTAPPPDLATKTPAAGTYDTRQAPASPGVPVDRLPLPSLPSQAFPHNGDLRASNITMETRGSRLTELTPEEVRHINEIQEQLRGIFQHVDSLHASGTRRNGIQDAYPADDHFLAEREADGSFTTTDQPQSPMPSQEVVEHLQTLFPEITSPDKNQRFIVGARTDGDLMIRIGSRSVFLGNGVGDAYEQTTVIFDRGEAGEASFQQFFDLLDQNPNTDMITFLAKQQTTGQQFDTTDHTSELYKQALDIAHIQHVDLKHYRRNYVTPTTETVAATAPIAPETAAATEKTTEGLTPAEQQQIEEIVARLQETTLTVLEYRAIEARLEEIRGQRQNATGPISQDDLAEQSRLNQRITDNTVTSDNPAFIKTVVAGLGLDPRKLSREIMEADMYSIPYSVTIARHLDGTLDYRSPTPGVNFEPVEGEAVTPTAENQGTPEVAETIIITHEPGETTPKTEAEIAEKAQRIAKDITAIRFSADTQFSLSFDSFDDTKSSRINAPQEDATDSALTQLTQELASSFSEAVDREKLATEHIGTLLINTYRGEAWDNKPDCIITGGGFLQKAADGTPLASSFIIDFADDALPAYEEFMAWLEENPSQALEQVLKQAMKESADQPSKLPDENPFNNPNAITELRIKQFDSSDITIHRYTSSATTPDTLASDAPALAPARTEDTVDAATEVQTETRETQDVPETVADIVADVVDFLTNADSPLPPHHRELAENRVAMYMETAPIKLGIDEDIAAQILYTYVTWKNTQTQPAEEQKMADFFPSQEATELHTKTKTTIYTFLRDMDMVDNATRQEKKPLIDCIKYVYAMTDDLFEQSSIGDQVLERIQNTPQERDKPLAIIDQAFIQQAEEALPRQWPSEKNKVTMNNPAIVHLSYGRMIVHPELGLLAISIAQSEDHTKTLIPIGQTVHKKDAPDIRFTCTTLSNALTGATHSNDSDTKEQILLTHGETTTALTPEAFIREYQAGEWVSDGDFGQTPSSESPQPVANPEGPIAQPVDLEALQLDLTPDSQEREKTETLDNLEQAIDSFVNFTGLYPENLDWIIKKGEVKENIEPLTTAIAKDPDINLSGEIGAMRQMFTNITTFINKKINPDELKASNTFDREIYAQVNRSLTMRIAVTGVAITGNPRSQLQNILATIVSDEQNGTFFPADDQSESALKRQQNLNATIDYLLLFYKGPTGDAVTGITAEPPPSSGTSPVEEPRDEVAAKAAALATFGDYFFTPPTGEFDEKTNELARLLRRRAEGERFENGEVLKFNPSAEQVEHVLDRLPTATLTDDERNTYQTNLTILLKDLEQKEAREKALLTDSPGTVTSAKDDTTIMPARGTTPEAVAERDKAVGRTEVESVLDTRPLLPSTPSRRAEQYARENGKFTPEEFVAALTDLTPLTRQQINELFGPLLREGKRREEIDEVLKTNPDYQKATREVTTANQAEQLIVEGKRLPLPEDRKTRMKQEMEEAKKTMTDPVIKILFFENSKGNLDFGYLIKEREPELPTEPATPVEVTKAAPEIPKPLTFQAVQDTLRTTQEGENNIHVDLATGALDLLLMNDSELFGNIDAHREGLELRVRGDKLQFQGTLLLPSGARVNIDHVSLDIDKDGKLIQGGTSNIFASNNLPVPQAVTDALLQLPTRLTSTVNRNLHNPDWEIDRWIINKDTLGLGLQFKRKEKQTPTEPEPITDTVEATVDLPRTETPANPERSYEEVIKNIVDHTIEAEKHTFQSNDNDFLLERTPAGFVSVDLRPWPKVTIQRPNRIIEHRSEVSFEADQSLDNVNRVLPLFFQLPFPESPSKSIEQSYLGALFVLTRANTDGTFTIQGGGNFDQERTNQRRTGAVPTTFSLILTDRRAVDDFLLQVQHYPQQTLYHVFNTINSDQPPGNRARQKAYQTLVSYPHPLITSMYVGEVATDNSMVTPISHRVLSGDTWQDVATKAPEKDLDTLLRPPGE